MMNPFPERSEEWYQWNRERTHEDMARWKREAEEREQERARPMAIAFESALKSVGFSTAQPTKKRIRPAAILGGQSMTALETANIPPREALLSTPEGPLF